MSNPDTANTAKTANTAETANNTRTTFVSFLLDETGSMEPIKDDTIGGFNEFVRKLQRADGDVVFSLVSFNSSKTRKRYVAEPIRQVHPLAAGDYEPSAMTPLIDASVKIIKATADAVAKRGDDPAVVIAIQTDGQENVSVEYSAADLALLVKEKEEAGWQFTFLGAGLDAFAAAREAGLHIDPVRVVSYDRSRSRAVFAASASNLADFVASGDASGLSFSDEQRDQVGDSFTRRYLDPKARRGAAAAGKPSLRASKGATAGKESGAKQEPVVKKDPTAKRGTNVKRNPKAPSSVDDFSLS